MTIMSGGFGLSGNPEKPHPSHTPFRVRNLTVISNNGDAKNLRAASAARLYLNRDGNGEVESGAVRRAERGP